ncbi:copper amine oxidase [Cytobacillus oceanisediminis]|uniref:copper amine oxidase n=1 Tax=Cytobacillus oceanisediminis TaxID=665099 RepID=UPI00203E735B|nr:copper amine oxidase [Cytobacillus oceanisediminis]MCM3406024.1 copper amine oxidase [Cytobacillus oceanisediminis]
MKLRKSYLAIPLSITLLASAGGAVSAHNLEPAQPSVETPASDLRSALGHLLSEHAYLAAEAMRKGAEGAKDFDAAANALNDNTTDLTAAIESVYGKEAAEQFNQMWTNHIGFFVDYVKASGSNNQAAKEEALNKLDNYRSDFSKFLEIATGERLESSSLADGLQMHVNQLVGAFDSYVQGDYEKAYQYERESIHHMYLVAKGLSSAISDQFPEKFHETMAVTPAADLRAHLDHLLTEHAGLAVTAMQNGIDGSEDFEASANALAANTKDLAAAISSVYGDEAGQQFEGMWSEHIGFFVEYVKASGANDEAKKEEALKNLDGYRAEFSKFLETATDGRLKSDALADGLQMHVNQLVGSFDSFAAGDYEKAYDQAREAYAHMLNPAKGLSGSIVDQFPEKFANKMPAEMPTTGMGGTAEKDMSAEMLLAGLFAAAGVTSIAIRRRMNQN